MGIPYHSLIGIPPSEILIHGPKKTLVSAYHWHQPAFGVIASYTPSLHDVEDHFGIFRGVDQIEAFAQATIVSLAAYGECKKKDCDFEYLKQAYIPLFTSVGRVYFHDYVEYGDVFICMGYITFFKFRQMICDGRIYKVPPGLDLDTYFRNYAETQFKKYELDPGFTLVAELFDITGVALKKEKFKEKWKDRKS